MEKLKYITIILGIIFLTAGCEEDFLKAFKEAFVDAALAASLFHYGEVEIPELKQYLLNNGVTIRI